MSTEQLERMSRYSIEDIPKSSLVEIDEVNVDTSLSGFLRMLHYLEQIQNPYCFLCDNTPVHISFVNEGQELSKALIRYFSTLK